MEVSPADIGEAELGTTWSSFAPRKLAIEDVLWQPAIIHALQVPKPAQAALAQQGVHAGDPSS